jgi:hypothetical protein
MEEKNSKKMDVSYGVESSESSEELKNKTKKDTESVGKKKKSTKKKTSQKSVKDSVVSSETKSVDEPKEGKKKKTNLIQQIEDMKKNGEVNTAEFRDKMSKLENVLGVDQINPFGTNERDIFEENLKGMTHSDLKDLAFKVGLNPFMSQGHLKTALVKEFGAQNKNNMRNIMPESVSVMKLDPDNPKHAKTINILGEI